jgi:diacylglycerol O-acyltransferase / wax synthase
VPLLLPVGEANPARRLALLAARMQQLKHSTQPLLSYALMWGGAWLGEPAQQALVQNFAGKASAVVTNVPGPKTPLHLAGSGIESLMFWVPAAGNIGLGVSLLSYAGQLHCGFALDAAVAAEPQALADAMATELDSLMWLALMLPWGEEGA